MDNDIPVVMLLEAGTAAKRLGVSASGLRRLSIIYEEVYEELPRKDRSNNRLWPEEAVERLQRARALVQDKKLGTIQEALIAIRNGLAEDIEVEAPKPNDDSTQQALRVLADEIRRLRDEVQELRQTRELPIASVPLEDKSYTLLQQWVKRIFGV